VSLFKKSEENKNIKYIELNGSVSMPRTANEKLREEKRMKILRNARTVFCRKGYLDVTMKDIIDECGISRGGIYLYFSSTAEIFQEIIVNRNNEKFSAVRKAVDNNEPFALVLGDYIKLQKERLSHMENSLLRAMYEYIFSKSEGATQEFRSSQLESLRNSVLYILTLGVRQGVLHNREKYDEKGIEIIADHFVIVIEGLGVLALTKVLTDKIIDEQFAILTDMIEEIKIL